MRAEDAVSTEHVTEDDTLLVKEGEHVILLGADDRRYFVEAKRGTNQRFGKLNCSVIPLIGQPYGSIFELTKKGMSRLFDTDSLTQADEGSALLSPGAADSCDNRSLVDTNTSQKLTHAEIEAMKLDPKVSGKEIIQALVHNSDTWESKTQFSQQKWLARKQQKHTPRVRLVLCEAESVCDTYYQKNRERVSNLRSDSLAQILAYGNVFAGGNVLVFDTVMGLVVSSVVERLGGHGRLLAAYAGKQAAFDAVKHMNFTSRQSSVLVPFHTSELAKVRGDAAMAALEDVDDSPEAVAARAKRLIEERPAFVTEKLASLTEESERAAYLKRRADRIKRQTARPSPGTVRNWLRQQCDSLIIATEFHPLTVLLELLPVLAFSAPFVIFCEFLEPLVQAFREVRKRNLACKLQLSNTWTREYQVLPGRTHPSMNMSSCGGYILTGIKVHRNDNWKFIDKSEKAAERALKRDQKGRKRSRTAR